MFRFFCRLFIAVVLLTSQVTRAQDLDDPVGDIEITSLSNVSLGSYGIISPEKARLPLDSWEGSGLDTIETLIDRLLKQSVPIWFHDTLRRLMGLRAFSPDMFLNEDLGRSQRFLEKRVAVLFHIGAADDVSKMVEGVPVSMRTESMDRQLAESYLWRLNVGEACRVGVGGGALERYGTPWWQRLQLLCQLVTRQNDQANLTLTLLEERNAAPGQYFQKAMRVLQDKSAAKSLKLPSQPNALEFAIADRIKHWSWPEASQENMPVVALQAIRKHGDIPSDIQEIAESILLEKHGALPEKVKRIDRYTRESLLKETPISLETYGKIERVAAIERVLHPDNARPLDAILVRKWQPVPATVPTELDRLQMLDAVAGNRSGEVVLLIAVVMSEISPETLSPAFYTQMLDGLKKLDLTHEATYLADYLRSLILSDEDR